MAHRRESPDTGKVTLAALLVMPVDEALVVAADVIGRNPTAREAIARAIAGHVGDADLVTPKEAAAELECGARSVEDAMRAGEIPRRKRGHAYVAKLGDVRAWLSRSETGAPKAAAPIADDDPDELQQLVRAGRLRVVGGSK